MKRNTTQRDRHRAIIRKAGGPCWICGGPINYDLPHRDPGEFVIDHRIPLAAGGADELWNLAPAHRLCNARKGDRDHAKIIKRSGALK